MQPRPNVREVAQGKWSGLLAGFGLPERALSGRHGPCPVCGGSDRFRFDDKEGRGTWFCSHCGAGDGVKLVMLVKGWDFREAAQEIERAAGAVQPGRQGPADQGEAQKVEALNRVWREARPLHHGDEAQRYLAGRGLTTLPSADCVRLHPGLTYRDGGTIVGRFPAMVARVVSSNGHGVTLHRTYLKDAKKAPVGSPKKLMPGRSIAGAAVRLTPAAEWIGIAEGIETALAAAQLFKLPVWSCISAGGIESFEPPEGVRRVTVFGDNDDSFTGQAAAYVAARRMTVKGIEAEVHLPPMLGDWLDYLGRQSGEGA
jgi:putative DNA primase/helicase